MTQLGILIGVSVGIWVITVTAPISLITIAVLMLYAWTSDKDGVVFRALNAAVGPILLGMVCVVLLNLVLAIGDAVFGIADDTVEAIDSFTFGLKRGLDAIVKPSAWITVGGILALWAATHGTPGSEAVSSVANARKRLSWIATAVTVVSSFSFCATTMVLLPRYEGARRRLVAHYENALARQRYAIDQEIAARSVTQSILTMPRRVFLVELVQQVLATNGDDDAKRTLARWVAEAGSDVPVAYRPRRFMYSSPNDLDPLRAAAKEQDAVTAAADAARREARATAEIVVSDILIREADRANKEFVESVMQVLLGFVDADVGIAEKIVTDFTGKLVSNEVFKKASAPVVDELARRLIARTAPPPQTPVGLEQSVAQSRARDAIRRGVEQFVESERRFQKVAGNVQGEALERALDAEVGLERDVTAVKHVLGDKAATGVVQREVVEGALRRAEAAAGQAAERLEARTFAELAEQLGKAARKVR